MYGTMPESDGMGVRQSRLGAFRVTGSNRVDTVDEQTTGRRRLLAGVCKRDAFIVGFGADGAQTHLASPASAREAENPRLGRLLRNLHVESTAVRI